MIAYDWQVIGMLMVSFNKLHVIGREREKDWLQLHHHSPWFFEHCVDAQKQRYMIFGGYSDRSLEWGRGQWIATGDYVFMAWFGNKIIDPFSGISPGILSWGESKASNQSSRLRIWNSKGCADQFLRKLGCPSWSSLCFSRYWGPSWGKLLTQSKEGGGGVVW